MTAAMSWLNLTHQAFSVPRNCSSCGVGVWATSERCRPCNMRRISAGKPARNRIFADRALTEAERTARWRAANPEKDKRSRDNGRIARRALIANYKAQKGCESCGIADARVLDLHHRDAECKVMAVSQMANRASLDAIKAEMTKCKVLCANCHRIEHYENTAAVAVAS